jgi:hypothetical protein
MNLSSQVVALDSLVMRGWHNLVCPDSGCVSHDGSRNLIVITIKAMLLDMGTQPRDKNDHLSILAWIYPKRSTFH